eukprot:m.74480 g.74480  ORF g.74480 m.74480 type:complete len:411 (-) comp18898_c0_seq1:112-1344(-)
MSLTESQTGELNLAVHEYLLSRGFLSAAGSLAVEATLENAPTEAPEQSSGMLEKKWTAVVRLQKKVMELESKLEAVSAELAGPKKLGGKRDATTWIPRPPGKEVKGHRLPVTRVLFHPVFSVFLTASEDTTMKIWDYESGDMERTLKGHTNTVQDIAFNAKGTLLASCSADMTIRLWDFDGFECTKVMRGHDHNVSSISFTPSGEHLISASRDTTIRIWEVGTGFNVRTIKGHTEWVRAARPDPSGTLIGSCGNDQTVRVWSFETGAEKHVMNKHTHVIEELQWAPVISKASINVAMGIEDEGMYRDGPFLATGARDKKIILWDAGAGVAIYTFAGHDSWVRSLKFHPGGNLLLSAGDDKSIRVWDLKTKRCTKTISAHNHFVQSIDMHPTTPYLVSGSVDQTAKIWECQ